MSAQTDLRIDVTHVPDYHVVSLTYSVTSGDDVTYDAPPPVEFETAEASFRLADGTLTCRMKVHFASQSEARAAIDPVLRAWEIDAALRLGLGGMRFQFVNAEVVDRTPVLPGVTGGQIHAVEVADTMTVTATVSAHVMRRAYPVPPVDFRITPDVETLWHRYQGSLEGREPLLAMAFFSLTVLEVVAGGRRKAARMYNIAFPVLKKLGELSSERGDPRTARKMPTPAMPPLSGAEEAWIHAAIRQIIWRLGDKRSSVDLPTIIMADLPPI